MNFSELPPSKQWAALKYRGEKFAEVWFKPGGEPFAILFRIRRETFQLPEMRQRLSAETLLKAIGVAVDEVDSWYFEGAPESDADQAPVLLDQPLPPPADDVAHLTVHVELTPPRPAAVPEEVSAPEALSTDAPNERPEPAVVPAGTADEPGATDNAPIRWENVQSRWRLILGVEATIDTMRLTMENLQTDMATTAKHALTTEEKLHALNADITHYNKSKTRVHYALPKVKEFIHRATWAVGAPERKKLEDYFKEDESHPDMPYPEMVKLYGQLENLLKDRQILSAHGVTVHQECKNICTDIQSALRTLQANAIRNADRKRRAAREGGKFFKSVRKWSGAE
jgi:hypothetical protein